jgi:WXG100 family type VII secretion target
VPAFVVDLPGLSDLVADIAAFEGVVSSQVDRLESEMGRLHGEWTGEAAAAQLQAHERLREGLAWMRRGLADMERAGRIAHANYASAVQTNQSMMDALG